MVFLAAFPGGVSGLARFFQKSWQRLDKGKDEDINISSKKNEDFFFTVFMRKRKMFIQPK